MTFKSLLLVVLFGFAGCIIYPDTNTQSNHSSQKVGVDVARDSYDRPQIGYIADHGDHFVIKTRLDISNPKAEGSVTISLAEPDGAKLDVGHTFISFEKKPGVTLFVNPIQQRSLSSMIVLKFPIGETGVTSTVQATVSLYFVGSTAPTKFKLDVIASGNTTSLSLRALQRFDDPPN